MTDTAIPALTDEEIQAGLSLDELKQLVGLVEYDEESDPFPVTGWDAVVWVVGNATQTAHYFQSAFGMELVAYSGPETGNRDHTSYVLRSGVGPLRDQGRGRPRTARSPTTTAGTATASSTSRSRCPTSTGASRTRAAHGRDRPRRAARRHRRARHRPHRRDRGLRRHPAHPGRPLPLRTARTCPATSRAARRAASDGEPKRLFQAIDHVVGNVELGQMDEWVEFYNRVMGFTNMAEFIGDDIATEYSALMSKVVANGNHRVKFPLNEPAVGKKKSQIDEYLEFYRGPGAQHLALATNDILAHASTRCAPRASSSSTRRTPTTRTRSCGPGSARCGCRSRSCSKRGILVDRDEDGYLLQIFTKPIGDRPTVFFELIERHGSLGFGKGNFKALFEAIEREQEKRGNL